MKTPRRRGWRSSARSTRSSTSAASRALANAPRRLIRISYTEAPQKNLRGERGRVRRIAMLSDEGAQVNVLAVSELPAATLIRGLVARWGRQENQLKAPRRTKGARPFSGGRPSLKHPRL